MTLDRGSIAIVLDHDFGERLRELAARSAVFVVDSPRNRPAIEAVWAERRRESLDRDLTVFRDVPGLDSQHHLFGIVRSLRNQPGGDPSATPVSRLRVFGLPLTDEIRNGLRELGFGSCVATEEGFHSTATANG